MNLTGLVPLICHNGQLANPLYTWNKKIKPIKDKRKKTEADIELINKLQFYGSLYLNNKGNPIIPADTIEACLINGAKKTKSGPKAKSGIFVEEDSEIVYDGPKTKEELWESPQHRYEKIVVIQRQRILTVRPIFKDWSLKTQVTYIPELVNKEDILTWAYDGGMQCAIGDYRPKFGRFSVKEFTAV